MVEEVVGSFPVGKKAEGIGAGLGHEFRSLFNRNLGLLEHAQNQINDNLETPDFPAFL